MFTEREFRLPRLWSNAELRRVGPLVEGSVVNVSGWKDSDKNGGVYRDYFPRAAAYTITNYEGHRGHQGGESEIFLDLVAPLPDALHGRFDAVFNHTTLEHIFEVDKAFDTLCALSRDLVILVAPFIQTQHENRNVLDYWRFTPTCLREMFRRRGFETVYESANAHAVAGIYIFVVATRHPDRWRGKMPPFRPVAAAGESALMARLRAAARHLETAARRAAKALVSAKRS